MKKKLLSFLKAKDIDHKKISKRTRYLIILALVALLLLILGNSFKPEQDSVIESPDVNQLNDDMTTETVSKDSSLDSLVAELEASYEKDLQNMLDKIQGVSESVVMVNLDSTNVKVYEKNLISGQQLTDESDKNGGIRKVEDQTEEKQVVLVRQGDQEVPLLIQTKKPEVRGVFVVAKGVDHATVKMWVIEAIAKVLDVPTHKVSVMPKN